jgi:hypothetical protein
MKRLRQDLFAGLARAIPFGDANVGNFRSAAMIGVGLTDLQGTFFPTQSPKCCVSVDF